jgi:hypothetical protein
MSSSEILRASFIWILGTAAVLYSLVTWAAFGHWHRSLFSGDSAPWFCVLHITIVIAGAFAVRSIRLGERRTGYLTLLFALTMLLASTAWFLSPKNEMNRAISKLVDVESALEDSRSPDWLFDESPTKKANTKAWLVEELHIRRAEELAATLRFKRSQRRDDSPSLLTVWAYICAGFTLLYWWQPGSSNRKRLLAALNRENKGVK